MPRPDPAAVLRGRVTATDSGGSHPDAGGGFQSQVVLTLTRGQRLRIAIDGYNGAQGTIRLRIAPA